MRTRGHHRTGAAAVAGLALLTVGAVAPAQAAEQPQPKPEQKQQTRPAPDVTAPERPALGEASTEAGGAISLPVQAESGSALMVREGAEVVASASALGVSQDLTWTTKSGPHTYLVVATDAAGNVSESASFTVEVDATPPSVDKFVVEPGTARDSRSRWGVVTEPGTAYELVVDGTTLAEGTTESRATWQHLDLTDGNHEVRLELRDGSGNLRTVSEDVTVEIPELWVAAKDVSADNATERSFKVASAPGTRGYLRVPGGATARFELPDGRAEVTVEVPEGSYEAPVVIVADGRDRKGTTKLAPFTVDLTAPALQVTMSEEAAARGLLAATVTAGAGDTVAWKLVDESGVTILSGQYVADGSEQRLDREVAEGSYELEVTATDAMGNVSSEKASAGVAGRPLVNPDAVPALAITLALWLLVSVAVFLRRRNRRRAALSGDDASSEADGTRGPRTKRARRAAAHQAALAEYQEQLAVFEREDQAWQQRRDLLAQLVLVAKGGAVEVPESTLALRPQERAFCDLPARLVEMRRERQEGVALPVEVPIEVDEGRLVITDARVAFVGATQRDWELAELQQLRHVGQDRTLMTVTDRKKVSGVAYADADLVRFYFDLAAAQAKGAQGAGSVRSIRQMLEQGVRSHELRRPQAPAPVGAAPSRLGRGAKKATEPAPVEAVEPVEVREPVEVGEVEAVEVGPAQPVAAPQMVTQGSSGASVPAVIGQQAEPADRELLLHS